MVSSGCEGLLHQQFLSSAMIQHCGLLPLDRMMVLPCMLQYSQLLHYPHLAGILALLQFCLQSLFGLPDVDLGTAAGDTIDCLPRGSSIPWQTMSGESARTWRLLWCWTSCKHDWSPHSSQPCRAMLGITTSGPLSSCPSPGCSCLLFAMWVGEQNCW